MRIVLISVIPTVSTIEFRNYRKVTLSGMLADFTTQVTIWWEVVSIQSLA